ncbi:MAG: hypothetical protein JWQ09_2603, partial [Segetibacter sp.]|nr:hypothetical protein [Segetibacter sp.]
HVPIALLTTTLFNTDAYIIKEMQPTIDKIDFHLINDSHHTFLKLIEKMARLTASAQLRSEDLQGSAIANELIAFGKSNGWQNSVLTYSREYANQVKNDYGQYLSDYKNGFFD